MASESHASRSYGFRSAFGTLLLTGIMFSSLVSAHAQTFSSNTSTTTITDNNTTGVSRALTVTGNTNTISSFTSFTITGLTHPYIGDLVASITHGTTTVDLFDHIGTVSSTNANYNYDQGSAAVFNGSYTFALSGTDITTVTDGTTVATTPKYQASGNATNGFDKANAGNSLASFVGQSIAGTWTFTIKDEQLDDTGSFTGFNFTVAPTPEPSQGAAFGVGLLSLAGLAIRARRRVA